MKRKILIFVCIILIILVVGIIFLKNRFIEQRIAILTYHGVVEEVNDSVDISVDYFEKQMKWLYDNNYKTITMDEFYKWKKGDIKLPLKTVMIVFDDGWRNNYLNALPILEKYDLNASIFVVWKYSKNSNGVDNPIYINDSDVEKIIEEYDNIELLSHSYNLHVRENADSNDYDVYDKDMKKVKSMGKNMEYYAYPFGARNENYIRALKDNGCKLAFTFGPYDFASRNDNDYEIPRMGIFEDTSFNEFKIKLMIKSLLKI